MNKTLFIFVILVLNVADFVLPTTAQAKEIQFVNATLRSTNTSGCISTEVFVFGRSGGFGSLSTKAAITISQIDDCKGVPLLYASGSAKLKNQDLQLDPNLVSATLDTTVKMSDQVSRRKFDVGINLAWAGVGGLNRTRNNFYFESPGKPIKEKTRFDATYRDAEVSGSVSDGLTQFTPESSIEGEMALAKRN